jgi:hypothetical protein
MSDPDLGEKVTAILEDLGIFNQRMPSGRTRPDAESVPGIYENQALLCILRRVIRYSVADLAVHNITTSLAAWLRSCTSESQPSLPSSAYP